MDPSSSRAPAALDSVVPPGSTAQEAFMLMQQERINALETDYADLTRQMKAVHVLLTPPVVKAPPPPTAVAAPPAVAWQPPPPPPPPPLWLPPPAAPPAAAVASNSQQPLLGQQPQRSTAAWARVAEAGRSVGAAAGRCANVAGRMWTRWDRLMHREEFYFFFIVVALTFGLAGTMLMAATADDLTYPNTKTTALVTNVTPKFLPGRFDILCTTDLTYVLHGGAMFNTSLQLESSGGVCQVSRIGTVLSVCYNWSKPSNVEIGECHASHAKGRREAIAGAVLLGVFAVPTLPCITYWVLRGVRALCLYCCGGL